MIHTQETSENPLKLPRKNIKPVDPKIYPEGIEENKDIAEDLARQGGSGGQSVEIPTYMRNEQSNVKRLPKDRPPRKISNN